MNDDMSETTNEGAAVRSVAEASYTDRPPAFEPDQYDMMTMNVMLRLAIEPRRPDFAAVSMRLDAFVRAQDLSIGADAIATRWQEADMDTHSRSGSNR